MLEYGFDQIWEVFEKASNINASSKKLLRGNVKKGDPVEKFIKTFRDILLSGKRERAEAFLEGKLEEYESCVLAMANYAHREAVDHISTCLVEKYSGEFNKTYSGEKELVTVSDPEAFKRILREVDKEASRELEQRGLPSSAFMRSVVFSEIFEEGVAEKVAEVLEGHR